MAIKVLILRRGDADCVNAVKPLLQRLRALALAQPGYESGETFINVEDSAEFLVISTWDTMTDWMHWYHDPERAMLQGQIDGVLGTPTRYQVFRHV